MNSNCLLIIGCRDSLLWYSHLVGQLVPLMRDLGDEWMSREPSGHTNIVKRQDAIRVPDGHRVVNKAELIERGDLIVLDGRLQTSCPEQWGQSAHGHMALRREHNHAA